MSTATLTLIGMYNFQNDLFDEMNLPDGVDKTTAIDAILLRGGEFEVIYSNGEFLKHSIGAWSRKWNRTIQKWSEALKVEYNPLENYDRREDWTDEAVAKGKNSMSSSGTTEDKRSAFDSSKYEPNSEELSSSNTSSDSSSDSKQIHSARIHGNIGVTTSQMMLQSELDIAEWSLYDKIADLFLTEFVIPIY